MKDEHTNQGLLFNQYNGARYMFGVMPTGPGSTNNPFNPDNAYYFCMLYAEGASTFFWSSPLDASPSYQQMSQTQFRAHMSALMPHVDPKLITKIPAPAEMAFARYADTRMSQWHVSLPRPGQPGPPNCAVVLGDSAHACSPQLGQGACLALVDALQLADEVVAAQATATRSPAEKAGTNYTSSRKNHLRFYQTSSSLLTPIFQSHSKACGMVRDAAFWRLNQLVPFFYMQSLLSLLGVKDGLFSSFGLEPYEELFAKQGLWASPRKPM